MHLNAQSTALSELSVENNFKLLDVMVDVPGDQPLNVQEKFARHQVKAFPDQVSYLTAFDLAHWNSNTWVGETMGKLKTSFDSGALGIKIWKNIGMTYKDSSDKFIMIDNPRFDSVIQYIINQDKTVMGHLGEPKS